MGFSSSLLQNFQKEKEIGWLSLYTGKSFSEALILASTNPQYDRRLFIELRVSTWKLQAQNMLCTYINWFLFWHSEQFMYTICTELVVFMYWTRNSMNNLLSYCGLVDARISASEKDLPVKALNYNTENQFPNGILNFGSLCTGFRQNRRRNQRTSQTGSYSPTRPSAKFPSNWCGCKVGTAVHRTDHKIKAIISCYLLWNSW